MIIDMHTHCFPDPLAKKAMPMLAMRSGNPLSLIHIYSLIAPTPP